MVINLEVAVGGERVVQLDLHGTPTYLVAADHRDAGMRDPPARHGRRVPLGRRSMGRCDAMTTRTVP